MLFYFQKMNAYIFFHIDSALSWFQLEQKLTSGGSNCWLFLSSKMLTYLYPLSYLGHTLSDMHFYTVHFFQSITVNGEKMCLQIKKHVMRVIDH